MTAFEVSLNGKKFCTAGLEAGVLSAIISRLKSPQNGARRSKSASAREFLSLSVGGLEFATGEHLQWKKRSLKQGDSVTLRITNSDRVDKPRERKALDPKLGLRSKQRYLRNLAKELGYTIVKKSKPTKKAAKRRAA